MLKHDLTPAQEPTRHNQSYPDQDDHGIELPTIDASNDASPDLQLDSPKPNSWSRPLFGAIMAAGLLCWKVGLVPGGSDESQHPNWQHVATATAASTDDTSLFVCLNKAGAAATVSSIEMTQADANRLTTWRVRAALLRRDTAAATRALQAAQQIPPAANIDVHLPDLSTNADLAMALLKGRQELFQMELFDCCQEDGDVVDVEVNGSHFTTVPILNAGTLLSIPLSSGNNTVTVRGSQDGRGGVTLSVRTSRGEYFARRLRVGQAYQLGVVVP